MTEQKISNKEEIYISDVSDVMATLTKLLSKEDINNVNFKQLVPLRVKLEGDDFHQSLTPDVMQGLLDFQEGIYRAYCQLQYGTRSLIHLKEHERKQLEIIVTVNLGSSDLLLGISDAIENLKTLLTDMESKHKAIAISTICLSVLSGWGITEYKEYSLEVAENDKEIELAKIQKEALVESQKNMIEAFQQGVESAETNTEKADDESQQNETDETSTIKKPIEIINAPSEAVGETIKKAQESHADIKAVTEIMDESVRKLLQSTTDADRVTYNGVFEASGSKVKQITDKPRRTSEEVVLSSNFRVLNIDAKSTDVHKVQIVPVDDKYPPFTAEFTDGTIGKEKIKKLNQAIWGYHPIELAVKGRDLHGMITGAMIEQVRSVDSSQSFKVSENA